jgi:DNA topoisomerase-1
VVNDLLVKHFSDIVDIEFTARMEKELDEIANDNRDWVGVIRDFYTPFDKSITDASQLMERVKLADELVEETCPQCGKPLAIKRGRYGKFLACSGYPECKFTKPYQIKIGVRCPECGSELIERLSKKRRIFYGCSNYPDCRFATNFRPLPDPCPNCGGLLTLYRERWGKCTKCRYRGKIEQD